MLLTFLFTATESYHNNDCKFVWLAFAKNAIKKQHSKHLAGTNHRPVDKYADPSDIFVVAGNSGDSSFIIQICFCNLIFLIVIHAPY